MRAVFGLVLIAGLGLAGLAVYMIQERFTAYENEIARQRAANGGLIDTVELYVANRPMKYGDEIKPENVRLVKWPANLQPQGAFHDEAALFPDPTRQRVMLRAIEPNEALTAVKVTKPGESAGITSLLDRGMRAFAIKVDVASGVSGFLRPGNSVDIYWSGQVQSAQMNREVTKMIEAGVKIIAIDQSANVDAPGASIARTVTVAVRPEQVAGLAQAQSTGRLSLSLVGNNDDTISETIEIDQNRLLGIAEAPAPERVVEKEQCTIRTRRGAEVVEIPIPCTN
ncbi:Flp pilus assembly protein CpaB [Aquicoccus porphyridii]|uniref:Flp pilus assembly protein CpaB n=1 Tax=Aquicoccus porphyridii TaxID=1852029 RepID=A0A5A9Z5L9_9RHOB|nr:Flp pilus assembly protein CpaB [Aquicoccus porphyridii]KAA0912412.1 Flp pilus assembly protein CpaB [Aquicoccus porphyridii]RAI53094.1 Flp pilus assembly protein CpaB [Rhodobacteraceae bacterium AsT-22]